MKRVANKPQRTIECLWNEHYKSQQNIGEIVARKDLIDSLASRLMAGFLTVEAESKVMMLLKTGVRQR